MIQIPIISLKSFWLPLSGGPWPEVPAPRPRPWRSDGGLNDRFNDGNELRSKMWPELAMEPVGEPSTRDSDKFCLRSHGIYFFIILFRMKKLPLMDMIYYIPIGL